ncbi:MAG: MFS transporter, partial [Solirubrobacteraceae bacterium]|nr:MFS transporter [Solirubrobacteraceae bacterium]
IEAGKASGATNAIRELGGVAGVAVLASVFAAAGGYASPQDFVDGIRAALPVGAVVLLIGAFVALLIPRKGAPGTIASPRTDAAHQGGSVPSAL